MAMVAEGLEGDADGGASAQRPLSYGDQMAIPTSPPPKLAVANPARTKGVTHFLKIRKTIFKKSETNISVWIKSLETFV